MKNVPIGSKTKFRFDKIRQSKTLFQKIPKWQFPFPAISDAQLALCSESVWSPDLKGLDSTQA